MTEERKQLGQVLFALVAGVTSKDNSGRSHYRTITIAVFAHRASAELAASLLAATAAKEMADLGSRKDPWPGWGASFQGLADQLSISEHGMPGRGCVAIYPGCTVPSFEVCQIRLVDPIENLGCSFCCD